MFGKFFFILIILIFYIPVAYAQTIPITISSSMKNVIFDGKWTFMREWKESSLDQISTDSGPIYIRTAHWQNYVYVFIDAVGDTYLDKGADRAMICFDTNNDKTTMPDSNDYCFVDVLDGKRAFVLQGGSPLGINDNFKKIAEPKGFIGISSVSDENDRYTPVPHPGYEFRIPTDLIGRSNIYGFYVNVYDAHANKFYSWPNIENTDNIFHVASPSKWGELVSPDSSLPEFKFPTLALLPAFLLLFYITKFRIKI